MRRTPFEGKHPLSCDITIGKRRTKEEPKKWGELRPINNEMKPQPIELNKKIFDFNKNTIGINITVDCNFVFDDDRKKGYLEVLSQLGCVYVNQKPVRKGRDKIMLEEGNEIGFYFADTYLYKFHYCDGNVITQPNEDSFIEQPRQIGMTVQTKPSKQIQTPTLSELTERLIYKPNEKRNEEEEDMWKFIQPNIKDQIEFEFKFCLDDEQLEVMNVDENNTQKKLSSNELRYAKISSLSRTLLLSTPKGTELFVSRLLKQISDEMNVPLLEIDCTLLGAVDGVEQETVKNFQYGDKVKYIGKGKKSNEEQLGKIGTVLYVADGKVAVNFENSPNGRSGAFVEIDMLGGIDEEVPNQDRRLIGRLPEILKIIHELLLLFKR